MSATDKQEAMEASECPGETGGYDGMFGVGCELPIGHSGPHRHEWENFEAGVAASVEPEGRNAEAWEIAARELRAAGSAMYVAASNSENAGDWKTTPIGTSVAWLDALKVFNAAAARPVEPEGAAEAAKGADEVLKDLHPEIHAAYVKWTGECFGATGPHSPFEAGWGFEAGYLACLRAAAALRANQGPTESQIAEREGIGNDSLRRSFRAKDPQAKVEAERRRLIEGKMSVQAAESYLAELEQESIDIADKEVELRVAAMTGPAPSYDPGLREALTELVDCRLQGLLPEQFVKESDRERAAWDAADAALAAAPSVPTGDEQEREPKPRRACGFGILERARLREVLEAALMTPTGPSIPNARDAVLLRKLDPRGEMAVSVEPEGRQITDAMVRRAAKAIYEVVRSKPGNTLWPTWEDRTVHQRQAFYRSARVSILAALSAPPASREELRLGDEAIRLAWHRYSMICEEVHEDGHIDPFGALRAGFEAGVALSARLQPIYALSVTSEMVQAAAIVLWEKGNERLGVERDREVIWEYMDEAEAALIAAWEAR
jgi:hypothetical protein